MGRSTQGRLNRFSQVEYALTGGTLKVGSLDIGPIEGFSIIMGRTPLA